MRFASAIAVIGATLPLDVSSQRHEKYQKALSRLKNLQNLQNNTHRAKKDDPVRILRNHSHDCPKGKQHGQLRQHVSLSQTDCDPMSDDPDVGVLSCGVSEYCRPDNASTLGGVCVHYDSSEYIGEQMNRHLEDYVFKERNATENFLWGVDFFCYSNYTGCTCSNLDLYSYTMEISCSDLYPEEQGCYEFNTTCGTQVYGCGNISLYTNQTGFGNYDVRFCIHNYEPGDLKICYYSERVDAYTVSCSVTVDGEDCDSCEVVFTNDTYCDENATCYLYTFDCLHFNCTNVEKGWAGVDCGNMYAGFLYDYGCDDEVEAEETTLPSSTSTDSPTVATSEISDEGPEDPSTFSAATAQDSDGSKPLMPLAQSLTAAMLASGVLWYEA